MRLAVAASALLSAAPAFAHTLDCKGQPVDGPTRTWCCGEADYHRLTWDQVSEEGADYVVVDNNHTFRVPRSKTQPTPDGCPAIFYSEASAYKPPTVYCFFFDPSF